jgi:phosphomannomutase
MVVAYTYDKNKVLSSTIDLPKSNVLKYFLDDESWFVLRPSGTEPKLKVYFSTVGATMEKAINKNNKLRTEVMKLIEKIK